MVELPRNEAFKTVQPAESAPAAEAMAAAAAAVETPKKNGRKFFKRAVIAAALLAGAAFAGDFGHHGRQSRAIAGGSARRQAPQPHDAQGQPDGNRQILL